MWGPRTLKRGILDERGQVRPKGLRMILRIDSVDHHAVAIGCDPRLEIVLERRVVDDPRAVAIGADSGEAGVSEEAVVHSKAPAILQKDADLSPHSIFLPIST